MDEPTAEDSALSRRIDALAATVDEDTPVDVERPAEAEELSEPLRGLRAAVEERLATIEDTLDVLGERLEAVARDTARASGDQLALLDERLQRLADGLAAGRAPHGGTGGPATGVEVVDAGSVAEWSESVSDALHDLGTAMERSLRTLAESLAGARPGHGDEPGQLEGVQTALSGIREQLGGELDELRGDLADALEETRDRLAAAVQTGTTRVLDQVAALAAAEDQADLRERIGRIQTEVTASLGDVSAAVVEALDSQGERITASNPSEVLSARLDTLDRAVASVQGSVADLAGSWASSADTVLGDARQAATTVIDTMRTELASMVGELAPVVSAHTASLGVATESLGASGDRLVLAGRGLLAYLMERDALLERDRDGILTGLLEQFAAGLSSKERTATAGRLGQALERRRDGRDAERWRGRNDAPTAPELPGPAELAALADLRVPADSADVTEPGTDAPAAPEPAAGAPAAKKSAAAAPAARKSAAAGPTTTVPSAAVPKKRAAPRKRVTATPAGATGASTAAPSPAPAKSATKKGTSKRRGVTAGAAKSSGKPAAAPGSRPVAAPTPPSDEPPADASAGTDRDS